MASASFLVEKSETARVNRHVLLGGVGHNAKYAVEKHYFNDAVRT